MKDYEGHWYKDLEATKEFNILLIGIVYKAIWKAKKKKFILLLYLPTFIHLSLKDKESSRFLICNKKKNWISYMLAW